MYYPGTIFGSDKATLDDTEGIFGVLVRQGIGQQLLVADAGEVFALALSHFNVRNGLVSALVSSKIGNLRYFGVFIAKLLFYQGCGQHDGNGGKGVLVVGLDDRIVDVGSNGQCRIGGQGPWCGGPGQDKQVAESFEEVWQRSFDGFKLSNNGGIGNIAVAARLVKFMRAEAGACCRRIGLDGIALVQQLFVVQLAKQPPYRLDVVIFKGDIGVVEVYPVTHLAGDVVPEVFVAHHGFAALGVVIIDADFGTDVFFGDAQFFFYAEFDGQAVGVPAAFAFYAFALHGLVATKEVFYRPRHDVVDAGHTIGGGGTFVKDKGFIFRAGRD